MMRAANAMASGMKKWSDGKRRCHYTWFHPADRGTAEKRRFHRARWQRRPYPGNSGQTTDPAEPDASFERRYPQPFRGPAAAGGILPPCFIWQGEAPVHPDVFIAYTGSPQTTSSLAAKPWKQMNKAAVDASATTSSGREESIRLPRLGTGILSWQTRPIHAVRSVDDH